MPNKSQTNIGTKDFSIVVSATWQRVLAEDANRAAVRFMNVGSHNMGIYWAPIGNAGTPPVPTGIGSAGVDTLVPTGSYEPDAGWIDSNELWVIGTASDVLTCKASPPLGS